jgi:hypothetical protein
MLQQGEGEGGGEKKARGHVNRKDGETGRE